MDINVQEDLNAVNDQITKLVEELNKVIGAREQLLQNIQNLNGVAMYLRGKMPQPAEGDTVETVVPMEVDEAAKEFMAKKKKKDAKDEMERSAEYPPDK